MGKFMPLNISLNERLKSLFLALKKSRNKRGNN